MDYDLSRIDYAICGITYPDTLKILPGQPKTQQKFAIGDKNGVLQCLVMKEEEAIVQFKTLPGKPITAVQLAASAGGQVDKIFTASGNEVKGYSRKGKVFLTVETALSETITAMCIIGADLILSSGRTITFYRDLNEYHSHVCDDRVVDIAGFAAPNSIRVRLLVLLANKGAVILDGGQQIARAAISSHPTKLAIPALHASEICAFYGAADGSIGLIAYQDALLSSKCLVEGRGLGSVVCVGWYHGNGGTHLILGRHDGSIQLYLINLDKFDDKPRLKFTYFCGEPVTSVAGGCIGSEEDEVLAVTFSGRIFALREKRLISGATLSANIPQDAIAARRSKLEAEIARLEKQTSNEREKYQRSTRSVHASLSTPPLLDIQYELSGATSEGWQEVKIVSAVPLDMLFIYCIRKLDLMTDTAAVLSVCPSQGNISDLLATVRCQAGTRRLWIRMRNNGSTNRAEAVQVLIYALPAGAPRVARRVTLRLPALPYYSQHEDPEIEMENRCWCQVQIKGSFSVPELTSWLVGILPGDLPRPGANVAFARSHTLLRTVIVCRYQRGLGVFQSDNVSTVAVFRDMIYNYSVEKNIRVEISCDIPGDCCVKLMEHIKLQYVAEYKKYKDIVLKKAMNSLDLDTSSMNEEEPILCKDYLRVWESKDNETENNFIELVDIIEQWYLDWRLLTLNGNDYNSMKNQLVAALKECKLDLVSKIFRNELLSP